MVWSQLSLPRFHGSSPAPSYARASLPKGHAASEETRQNAAGSVMHVYKQKSLRRT
jgi:hypothetical protein